MFKVDKHGEKYEIKCYRTKSCGWNPNQDIKETKEEKEKRVANFLAGKGGKASVQDIRELMIEQKGK